MTTVEMRHETPQARFNSFIKAAFSMRRTAHDYYRMGDYRRGKSLLDMAIRAIQAARAVEG
jgi:hypothetical protein